MGKKYGFMCEWGRQWKMHRTWISLQLFRSSTCEMKIWNFTDNIATENILHIKRAFVKQTFLLQCIAIGIAFLSISESEWQYLIVWNLSLKSKEVYREEFFDLKLNEIQHEIWKFWEIETQLQKFSSLNFSEIGQRIDWYQCCILVRPNLGD